MKKSNIIILVVIAVAVAVIVSLAGDFSTYETFETAIAKKGEEFHIIGVLDEQKPMTYNPKKNANYFSFYMKDESGAVNKVVYRGSKPRDFEKSEQIVLAGSMGEDGVFQCSHILMKCPSKYTPEGKDLNQQLEAQASL